VALVAERCAQTTAPGPILHAERVGVAIAALAGRQHGVIAYGHLRALGLSPRAIGLRVAQGLLHPLHPRVYAVGHRVVPARGRWLAAVLAVGPGAALSHVSAAGLWDLWGGSAGLVDVCSASATRAPAGVRLHRARRLIADVDVTAHQGVPVTTVARTLVDLGAVLDRHRHEHVWRRSETLRLFDARAVADQLGQGRPGAAAARALLAGGNLGEVLRSELEERFRELVRRAELPAPIYNAALVTCGRSYEADALWREHGLVAEVDGWRFHGTRAAFESDRRRDADLLVAGLRVVRFTARQVSDEPRAVAAVLARLLGDPRPPTR
jgi:very-short-patch-repair endonuclease